MAFCYHESMKTRIENATTIRPTEEVKRLLKALSEKLGISQNAVVEIAIRKLAEQEKVK